ncbi:MAG: hypothetical protein ACXWQ5_10750, partial [Ktedonobacterales bacterium]
MFADFVAGIVAGRMAHIVAGGCSEGAGWAIWVRLLPEMLPVFCRFCRDFDFVVRVKWIECAIFLGLAGIGGRSVWLSLLPFLPEMLPESLPVTLPVGIIGWVGWRAGRVAVFAGILIARVGVADDVAS